MAQTGERQSRDVANIGVIERLAHLQHRVNSLQENIASLRLQRAGGGRFSATCPDNSATGGSIPALRSAV